MSQTLPQIQAQIARLLRDEERLKAEAAEVIAKIRAAIEAYGLTPSDLFTDAPRLSLVQRTANEPTAAVRYADDQGNVWGGRGPRPLWLRTALAQGRSLEDFAVVHPVTGLEAGPADTRKSAARSRRARRRPKRVAAIKYRDGDNLWSGRGSYPRWLREAIEQGRRLEEFAV